jgi:hypothetical protein
MRYLLFLAFIVVMSACQQNPQVVYPQQQQGYDVIPGDNGQQMARTYYNGAEIYMELALFNSLMNSGGYGSVYSRYQMYPNVYGGTTIINHYHSRPSVRSYSYSSGKSVAVTPRAPQNWQSRPSTKPVATVSKPSAWSSRPSSKPTSSPSPSKSWSSRSSSSRKR